MTQFRSYDIRGIYPDEIDENFAYNLGLAFSEFLKLNKRGNNIVVGKDNRIGSPELQENFIKGCIENGINVSTITLCTSPALYYITKEYNAGIMITASHNPKEFNGFKFCYKSAVPLSYNNGLGEVEKLMHTVQPSGRKGNFQTITLQNYLDKIIQTFEKTDFKGIKVVVDSGNGSAASTYPIIFKALGIKYFPIFSKFDGKFPNRDPNPAKPGALKELKKSVKEHGADIGLAFDADADRLIVVNEKGKVLETSSTANIVAKYYLNQKQTFVAGVGTSKSFEEYIHKNNGQVIQSKVGQVNIKKKMREFKAILGVEDSGHITYKNLLYIDDALYSALVILNEIITSKKKLSQLQKKFDKYHLLRDNVKCKNKQKVLIKIKSEFKGGRFNLLDGISITFPDWWANIRPSNTEDFLRIIIESKSFEIAEEKLSKIKKIIKSTS